jgi:DnaJ-class molecular chaperone
MNQVVVTHNKPTTISCPECRGDGAIRDSHWKPKENNLGHQGYRPCRRCGGCGKIAESWG